MPEPTREELFVYNLGVVFFNWLPAIGCLAVGVTGLVIGISDAKVPANVGGGVYLLAAAAGFASFGWVWRR